MNFIYNYIYNFSNILFSLYFSLQGGYCLKSLSESAALTLRTLLSDPCPMLETLTLPSIR